VSDEIVYVVCEKFLEQGWNISKIWRWLKSQKGYTGSRESVYPLLRLGQRRGFVILLPPRAKRAAERIADRYQQAADSIRVVDVRGPVALERVAVAAADQAVDLIKALGRKKKRDGANDVRVHVGLGAGWTTRVVARRLADRLRLDESVPALTLHALSSGFAVTEPRVAPGAFFNFFDGEHLDIEFVGLFAPAAVPSTEYEQTKSLLGVKRSFQLADEIDIVITSLASASDPDSGLGQFMDLAEEEKGALLAAGWVGDLHYRPYSRTGPIQLDPGMWAVVLFELPKLLQRVRDNKMQVILVAGPCGRCGRSRSDALRPLLEAADLKVWSWIMMDLDTAEELVGEARLGAPTRRE
jgi:hypothetical protein